MIYKKDQKASDKDIKGAIDLSEVETVEVSAKGDIDVVSGTGQWDVMGSGLLFQKSFCVCARKSATCHAILLRTSHIPHTT